MNTEAEAMQGLIIEFAARSANPAHLVSLAAYPIAA